MKHIFLLAAAAVSSPAFAQDAPAPQTTEAAPAVDAELINAAKAVVERLFPNGAYARVMSDTLEKVVRATVSTTRDKQIAELAVMGWLTDDQFKQLSDENIAEMVAIIDPISDKRMALAKQIMTSELGKAMGQLEPQVRQAIILAYARRFTPDQLADIANFFSTPTGSVYASESIPLILGPEVMDPMMSLMPKVGEQIPAMMQEVETATAKLPRTKPFAKLSKAERKRLATLMGMTEAELARRNKPLK